MSDINPCYAPCPKCGSSDASRRFIAYGSSVHSVDGKAPHKYLSGPTWKLYAVRDIIRHDCRVCGYVWAGPTMKKARRVAP